MIWKYLSDVAPNVRPNFMLILPSICNIVYDYVLDFEICGLISNTKTLISLGVDYMRETGSLLAHLGVPKTSQV